VLAAYSEQLRQFYEGSLRPGRAKMVRGEYDPVCLGDWFHDRLVSWSRSLPKGRATPHIFRKTSLQYARKGEDINRQVAADAKVSESVLMTSYVKETDEEMRQASNRTFHRILAGLPPEVARRYGHVEKTASDLEGQLKIAAAAKDWTRVAQLSAELAGPGRPPAG
jgi:phosphodiesterase/alkaline phosphatase D-like protein